jgi:uncharacterized membrane protein SirB2
MYAALKHIHVVCVAVSIFGFVARFGMSVRGSPWLRHGFVRMAPHAVDTLLLAAAIGMLVAGPLDPLDQPWLLAKICGLLAYIVLGTYALRRASTPSGRTAAFVAALFAFAYVTSAALSKSAWGFIPAG